MTTQLFFWALLVVLLFFIVLFDIKYSMLRDMSTANRKPHSFARVQLTWWSVIILTSFVTILVTRGIPTFDESTLILLGISAATTGAARLMDVSDKLNKLNKKITSLSQDQDGEGFFLDILSDENGVSIHRFQTVVFNIAFGIWFVFTVLHNLVDQSVIVDKIMPEVTQNNLILLGISSATYAGLKATENKENS